MFVNWKRMVIAILFGAVAIVASPAALGQAVVTDTPITDQTETNTCNGDVIVMNGTLHQETIVLLWQTAHLVPTSPLRNGGCFFL